MKRILLFTLIISFVFCCFSSYPALSAENTSDGITVTGTGIKLADDENAQRAIRFKISADSYAIPASARKNAEYGAVVLPTELVSGDLTVETENAAVITAKSPVGIGGGVYTYVIRISGLPHSLFKTSFSVRPYISYVKGGEKNVVYGETCSSSVLDAAKKAYSNKYINPKVKDTAILDLLAEFDESYKKNEGKKESRIVLDSDGREFSLMSFNTKKYLEEALSQENIDYADSKFKSIAPSYNASANIKWSYNGINPDSSKLYISEKEDLSDALVFETTETSYKVPDLKTNAKYYWYIEAHTGNGTVRSDTGVFYTADGARVLLIPGVNNVRDIGTWCTADGRHMKEGMAFRGASADGITDAGIEKMVKTLGVRTEVDLRHSDEGKTAELVKRGKGVLGDEINYYQFEQAGYYSVTSSTFTDELRVFAHSENYPIFFHCVGGLDRTGTLALCLEAICGCDEITCVTDYEMSQGRDRTFEKFPGLMSSIRSTSGKTFSEKVRNKVLSCGLSREELSNIYNLLMNDSGIFTGESFVPEIKQDGFYFGIDQRDSGGIEKVVLSGKEAEYTYDGAKLFVKGEYADGTICFADGETLSFGTK